MKTLSEKPKTRLVIFSSFVGIGLALLTVLIVMEFVNPHNPNEPMWTRMSFVILTLIPTSVGIWGIVETVKEIRSR